MSERPEHDDSVVRKPKRVHPQVTLEVQCKLCQEVRAFRPDVNPDPQGRAQVRAERGAMDWLACHPCRASADMGVPAWMVNQRKKAA